MVCWAISTNPAASLGCGKNGKASFGFPVTPPRRPQLLSHDVTRFLEQQHGGGMFSLGMITTLSLSPQHLTCWKSTMQPPFITSSFGFCWMQHTLYGLYGLRSK